MIWAGVKLTLVAHPGKPKLANVAIVSKNTVRFNLVSSITWPQPMALIRNKGKEVEKEATVGW
jgi:hypothetical protein